MSQHDTSVTTYVGSPHIGPQTREEVGVMPRGSANTDRGDLDKVVRVCGDGTVGKNRRRVTATTVPLPKLADTGPEMRQLRGPGT